MSGALPFVSMHIKIQHETNQHQRQYSIYEKYHDNHEIIATIVLLNFKLIGDRVFYDVMIVKLLFSFVVCSTRFHRYIILVCFNCYYSNISPFEVIYSIFVMFWFELGNQEF